MSRRVLTLLLVAVVAVSFAAFRHHRDRADFHPDGFFYLSAALVDRGVSPEDARRRAKAFMLTTPGGGDPKHRVFYGDHPPQRWLDLAPLFRNRPLYPALAAALYPAFGPGALKIVSAAAYVATVVLLYVFLLELAPPWLAALGALGFAVCDPVLSIATQALTDSLALTFWVAAFATFVRYLRRPSTPWLLAFLAATALLTLTRPATYLCAGLALGGVVAALRVRTSLRPALCALGGVLAIAAGFLAYSAAVHGPGLLAQIRWEYQWAREVHVPFSSSPLPLWWSIEVADAIKNEAITLGEGMFLPIVLGAVAIRHIPARVTSPLLGGAAATLVALVANPIDLARTVTLPLIPIAVVFAVVAVRALAGAAPVTFLDRVGLGEA